MSDPLILAFDTSAAHCAAALLSGDHLRARRREDMTRGQAERLMPMLAEMLAAEALTWSDVGLLAVGIGPGNFTGIRIGVAAARGLALGLGVPAMGVSSFEIMLGEARPEPRLVSLTGPRGSHYVQRFANGACAGAAMQISPGQDARPDLPTPIPPVRGHDAGVLARFLDPDGGGTAQDVAMPDHGPAIARIALARWRAGETAPIPPAPLYVRPADAAPPRDAPPVLLD
jgi:tRNA threonylcarbamoyladenosine biosynthesis protein TsaB